MPKRSLNSNTVSYFNLKSTSKSKGKSQSRSPSRSPNQRKSRSDETKGKNLAKSRPNQKRTKSIDPPKTKGTKNQQVKKPVRTGNVPHDEAKKKKEDPLPKDLFDAKFRGKKVLIFKNSNDGHLVEEPLPLAVSEHSYPTFDSLLNHLNQKLNLRTGRVNKLYKIQGGEITEVKQLRDKGWYVASTGPYVPEGAVEKIAKGKPHKKTPKEEEDEEKAEEEEEFRNVKNGTKNDKKQSKTDNHLGSNLNRNGKYKSSIHKKSNLKSSSSFSHEEQLESPRNPTKKPPVPKFKTKKERSFIEEDSEIVESPRSKPILKSSLKTSDKPFGRMGTLKNAARSQSLNSNRNGKVANNRKPSLKPSEQFEEVESDMYERQPARSMSSQSILRNKRDPIEEESYGYNEPEFRTNSQNQYDNSRRESLGWKNNTIKDYATEEQVSGARRQSDYPRESSEQMQDGFGYQRTSSAKFRDRFEEPTRQVSSKNNRQWSPDEKRYSPKREMEDGELAYEPSEMEPMNKVMYPSKYRPQSRKDAGNSARALQRDAAISAYKRDGLTSAKVGSRRYSEERYGREDEQEYDEVENEPVGRRPMSQNGRRPKSNTSYEEFNEENYEPYEDEYYNDPRETRQISNQSKPTTKVSNVNSKQLMSKNSQISSERRSRKNSNGDKNFEEREKYPKSTNKDKYDFSITVNHSRQ